MATCANVLGSAMGLLGSTSCTTNGETWNAWNNAFTIGSTATITGITFQQTQQTWVSWNDQIYQQTAIGIQQWNPITPEQQAAMVKQCEERQKEIDAAKAKAETLLLEHLNPEQRASYVNHGLFIVETPKKNRYKLDRHRPPYKVENDKHTVSYCIHTHGVPKEDELLGFKLLLEANEEEFLRTANATRLAA